MSGTLDEAIRLLGTGDLPGAERMVNTLLETDPTSADGVHLLGLVRYRQGRMGEAIELMQRSIAMSPENPHYQNNLGETYRSSADLPLAAIAYEKAIQLRPDYPEAIANFGLLRAAQRDLAGGEALFREAIRLRPGYAEAHQHLGNVLREQGRFDEAVAALQTAVQTRPNYPKAWHRLGLAYLALARRGEAIEALRKAVTLDPNFADAWFDLGTAFREAGRLDLAADCWERTIPIAANGAGASVNLASVRTRQGKLGEAVTLLRRAVELNPDLPAAFNNLGNALADQGKLDEAVEAYRDGVRRHPADFIAHSNLLFILNHHPDYPPDRLFAEHLTWARQHAGQVTAVRTTCDPQLERTADRPLRVGYVSADFKDNQVGFFLEPLLANHDRRNYWVKCYSDVEWPDGVTERMRRSVDEWENTLPLSDERLAERVRADRIDVLVDLTVHAGRHRLLMFARRPSPVQLTYLGYPNTTGLAAIDYRLTDVHLDPPGMTEAHHAEKLLRLPETYFCYRPSPLAPKVGPLPYHKEGRITFGSFNRLVKVTEPTIAMWAKVLIAVPRSRLVLKAQGLADPPTVAFLASRFAAYGVAADRLEMHGWTDLPSYLALMNWVDIGLDPAPFAGGTTTCHLLWMGVPVVTLAGSSPVNRIGVSLLANVKLNELIAETPEDYVRIAASLAKDTARLAKLRSGLRERVRTSPLLDAARFARNVESAYRAAWRRWCTGEPADHVTLEGVG